MQQKWWLVAAGALGIGLAILLFPKPDTGDDIPSANPENRRPLDFKGQSPDKAERPVLPNGPKRRPILPGEPANPALMRRPLEEGHVRRGPNPIAAETIKRRSQPESLYAGRASAPFSMIRRELLLMGTDESKEIANEMASLISDLRSQRRDPDLFPWDELEGRMNGMGDQLKGTDYMSNEQISQSLTRLDGILVEYKEAAENYVPPE
jgi:hypothetical protein